MANATPTRSGQIENAGAVDALWLKVFAGEVLTYANNETVYIPRSFVRTISTGKSAQFPAIGKTTSAYHTPGVEITGNTIKANERIITLDEILISPVFVADIDELKNHYDVRSAYREQMVQALVQTQDMNLSQVITLAARAAGIADSPGGTVLTNAAYGTNSDTLAAGIFAAAQSLDEKQVPSNDRYVALRPAQFYLAAQNTKLINKDWAGSGSYAKGTFDSLAGFEIVKTNNLTQSNVASGPAAYQGNFTTQVFQAWQKNAVGTLKRMDLQVRSDYDPRRLGTLLNAMYLMAHGYLRPNYAVEGKSA
jgi:hypothetical protein